MLHAMHDDRALRRLGDLNKALEAQQVRPRRIGQRLQEERERDGGDRLGAPEREGRDAGGVVMAVRRVEAGRYLQQASGVERAEARLDDLRAPD